MTAGGSTAANPDGREFYDQPAATITDPADDLPLTVRVQGGHDRHTRLFDRDAVRAVRTDSTEPRRWFVVAGPATPESPLTDEQVADWTVVPVPFTSTPWSSAATRLTESAAPELFGDMGVESFRGDRRE